MSDPPSSTPPPPPARPPTLQSLLTQSSAIPSPPTPERIRALYAFTSTQKLTNPAGYEKNYRWWVDVLREGMREGLLGADEGAGVDRMVVKGNEDELVGKLEWVLQEKNGIKLRPKGLGGVLSSLTRTTPPTLYPLQPFLTSPQPINQPPSLTYRLLAQPLWWAVGKVNPFAGSGSGSGGEEVETEEKCWKRVSKTEWVHLDLLEEAATNLISHLRANPPITHSSLLLTPEILVRRYKHQLLPSHLRHRRGKGVDLSVRDGKVLLKYLKRDKKVLVSDSLDEVYKIVLDEAEYASAALTDADKGTIAILSTLDKLDRQIEALSTEITSAQAKASHHLKLNQKNVAISYLRSKKQLESVLEKRVGAAEQLRSVLRGIENAHGDVEIMQAYEASTATLKSVLSHPSLQRDHIETTMDALAESMADQQEIDDAIQSGGQVAVAAGAAAGVESVDEDALQKELEGLVIEREREREEEEREERKVKLLQAAEEKKQERELVDRLAALKPRQEEGDVGSPSAGPDSALSGKKSTADAQNSDAWEAVYEQAQARKVAEAARADASKLKKESRVSTPAQ
ncbi:hypothetical protein QFC24_005431 [Naganishia onofrii]|uniref:Uncharacterized protein n=1 Tax=Naganishia onofrii TaxID=1851511 RepID=A0ACC2X7E8_9TREE|nr:hypothetical protein QFC24_005431 [Naganishia onofrii]